MANPEEKNIKIRYSCKNGVGKYVITYSSKNKKLGAHILKKILESSSAVINIDTSLSFMDKKQFKDYINTLKNSLESHKVNYYNRTITSSRSDMSALAQFLLYGKTKGDREIITFELNKDFNDDSLIELIVKPGCEVFVSESLSSEIIQDVFNSNYQDEERRFDVFKYVIYINDYVDQAALYTKTLGIEDVKKICI